MITKKWKKSYQPIYPIFFWAYNTKNIYFALPLISLEIMKTIDEREMKKKAKKRKKKKKNKQRQKGARGAEATAKGWELNDFVVHLS